MGVSPGLRDRDGGSGAAGAERVSGGGKPHHEGLVEEAVEVLGRRARHARAAPRPLKRPLDPRSFPSAITSSLTLAGVDGVLKFLLCSKGFSEVDQTTETEQTPIFGL